MNLLSVFSYKYLLSYFLSFACVVVLIDSFRYISEPSSVTVLKNRAHVLVTQNPLFLTKFWQEDDTSLLRIFFPIHSYLFPTVPTVRHETGRSRREQNDVGDPSIQPLRRRRQR